MRHQACHTGPMHHLISDRDIGSRTFPGATTGLAALDGRLQGLKPGTLIVLASRTAVGKTALALHIAAASSRSATAPVIVFSLEMLRTQVVGRMVAAEGLVETSATSWRRPSADEWGRMASACDRLREAVLRVIDLHDARTVAELGEVARGVHAEAGGLELIVVDYVQLLGDLDEPMMREAAFGEIGRRLKRLAHELHCPVLAVSQLSWAPTGRDDQVPQLEDLDDAGALQHEADDILLLHRADREAPPGADWVPAEVHIAKHHRGAAGVVHLAFLPPYTRYEDLPYRDDTATG